MSLVTGGRIGPYEIIARVGRGGMGEVFRARDLRLKRDVALKALHAPSLDDPDIRRRFDQEAQTLAALNHPNIAQVFGVETSDGTPVIAMEFVEGRPLDEQLGKGPLPVPEALGIAAQLCRGLDAAHERGVVHRDLKPANIKVRNDGVVKILDFGIARGPLHETSGASGATTVLTPSTSSGIILGTGPYMSPEQARGLPVDRRTDIWSFGCVLYEMLTGRRPFDGATTTDVLLAVVQQDPDWSRLPAAVPPRVVELLKRCLARNVSDRQRDIADAGFELERATGVSSGREPSPSAAPPGVSYRAVGLAFAGGAVLGALSLLFMTMGRSAPVVQPVVRTTVTLPPDTALALSRGSVVVLSPDGRRLVYAAASKGTVRLYRRDLDRFDTTAFAGTEDATSPFFSPDGKWIGYFAKGKLLKVSLDGGSPLPVADAPNARGYAWSTDGTIYLTPANNQAVWRLPEAGGKTAPQTALHEGELSHRWPMVLPDASALLFTVWNDIGWEPSRIVAQRIRDGQRVDVVAAGGGYPHYIRDGAHSGFLVYARAEGLLAARFDEATLGLTSPVVPVLDGLMTNLSGGAHFDLSSSGTLAYVAGTIGEGIRDLRWVAPDGTAAPMPALTVPMGRFWGLSPDGTRVARNNTDGPTRSVWIDDLSRKVSRRLTGQEGNFSAVWTPDGKAVVVSRGTPSSNLYLVDLEAASERRLTTSVLPQDPDDVSPDGRWLLFSQRDPGTAEASGRDIWVLPLNTPGAAPRALVQSRFAKGRASFSPDGRWFAFESNESGRFEVYVCGFPDCRSREQVSVSGGTAAHWSPSSPALYFRSADGKMMMSTFAASASAFDPAPPRLMFDASRYEMDYAVAPDGKRFLMMPLAQNQVGPTQIQLISNFIEELRRRVK